jgi:hypothetical protein
MHRQESLRMRDGFEPPHLAFALPGRLMREIGSIVFVLPGAVHDRRCWWRIPNRSVNTLKELALPL